MDLEDRKPVRFIGPTAWTSAATRAARSPSPPASTPASAPPWPAWKPRSRSGGPSLTNACPSWAEPMIVVRVPVNGGTHSHCGGSAWTRNALAFL